MLLHSYSGRDPGHVVLNSGGGMHQYFKRIYRSTLGPVLPLFFQSDSKEKMTADRVQKEKPVSPSVNGRVKTPPTSLAEMCQQLKHRIQGQALICSALVEDQQALEAVITSELDLIWQDLNSLMDEPTLTKQENRQLQSETCQEVLRLCQELYLNYLHLLMALRRRAVFTDQANRSRVVAQMAADCTRLLNVHSVRRYIATGIKASRKAQTSAGADLKQDTKTHTEMPLKLDLSVTMAESKTPVDRTVSHEIIEKMGLVDLEKAYDLTPCHLEQITRKEDRQTHSAVHANLFAEDVEPGMYYHGYTRLKGCSSMPDLQRENLLEELEMKTPQPRAHSRLVLLDTGPCPSLKEPLNPADDLRRLLLDRLPVDCAVTDPDADIPPLIRALTCRSSTKLQLLTLTLQKLEEKEEKQRSCTVAVEEPVHLQGDVVNVALSHGSVARTAAARLSDRVHLDTINIHPYPPVLTEELELSSVQWLDRNLFPGKEIKEVYKELSKSISTQFLSFNEDTMIEPTLNNHKWSLKNHQKLINPQLKRPDSNTQAHRNRTEITADHKKPLDQNSRAYTAWLQWWKTNLSLDDYLRYISNQDSDYLWAVFHLYNSDDEDEEEDEKERLLHLQRHERKKRHRQKIEALKGQKQEYVTGLWNVNTVLLGGLGKDPELEGDGASSEEDITSPKQAHKKTVSGGWASVEGEHIQSRLERIWTVLCLPDAHRLDMAIKYSCHAYRDQLEEATAAWEQAAHLIQQRETVLARLELFEREASDPNRFFLRGYQGTSKARMDEAKHRSKLNSQISSLEKLLSKILHHITDVFQDTVTYKGRPYEEKMCRDRVEMLYWLQQERRIQALDRVVDEGGLIPARLPSLNSPKHTP
ncbi:hypothetical protein UPYG_G00348240 [Umbra pygmaea]|uniref:Coiled-coil domain-containing protein 87 n=1 Tax=Umbra pygmaea TaxID=75934 RepID=A0ABD0VY44_UMBPY